MTEISQQFSLFMNPDKMKTVLQNELPECLVEGWQLTNCAIQHPRYKTYLNPQSINKSFLALAYHLKGIFPVSKKSAEIILYVKVFLEEGSKKVYQKAYAESRNGENHLPLHIERLGMVAWYFPHDPVLTQLPTIVSITVMQGYIADCLSTRQSYNSNLISDLSISIINYRPELRCTVRYDLTHLSGITHTLYGKVFVDEKGATIHDRMVNLRRHMNQRPYRFIIPEPLKYDKTLKTLWLEGLEGCSFLDVVNKTNSKILMTRLAQCLVELHNIEMLGLDKLCELDQISEIQKKAHKLQNAFPLLSPRIKKLIEDLSQDRARLPTLPNQLIHGDFHIQQLLITPDQHIALFDFDELLLANPLIDLANFSADLYNLTLDKKLIDLMVTQLVNAYQSLSGLSISLDHFVWHMKLQLVTRAYRAYIQQKPNLNQLIHYFLAAAETCCFDDGKGYFHA